jgi:hypothetical protein
MFQANISSVEGMSMRVSSMRPSRVRKFLECVYVFERENRGDTSTSMGPVAPVSIVDRSHNATKRIGTFSA